MFFLKNQLDYKIFSRLYEFFFGGKCNFMYLYAFCVFYVI